MAGIRCLDLAEPSPESNYRERGYGGCGGGGGYWGGGGGEERCKASVILTLNTDAVSVFVFSQCKTLTPSAFYPNFV